MKICMLAYAFYESDNRIRRYAETLARRGDDVEVVAIGKVGALKKEVISGVKVIRLQTRVVNEKKKYQYFVRPFLFLVKSFIYVTKEHVRDPYKLIHVHSVPDFEVFAALLPKLSGAKVILDIHDIVPEFYSSKFNCGKKSLITKLLVMVERWCCKFADQVIISNDIWRDLITTRSVSKEKCTSIINYPDTSIFTKPENLETNSKKFVAMYPGTLNYHQGVDIAVKAIAIARNSIPEIEFHVFGAGPLLPVLENLVKELSMVDTVFLHGMLPLHEVAKKMASADLGIVPKRAEGFGNEAFSTKILEFMALGVPVIASETKIDRYYFQDDIIKFFHSGDENDLAEKIISLYTNKQERLNLAQSAYRYAIKNCWENKKEIYFNIIDSLLGHEHEPVVESAESVAP